MDETTAQPGADNSITVENAKVIAPTTWKFGSGQFNKVTPEFARNIFDMYFITSKAIVGWLAAVQILSTRNEFIVTMTITLLLDVIVKGLTKMFGVTVDSDLTNTDKQ